VLTLRELQAAFCRSVAGQASENLLLMIVGDNFDPAARIAIYRNNVVTRLTDALSATYPVVHNLVERRFFEYAAGAFIQEYPPVAACLSEYGAEFPTFLAEFSPAIEIKYLPDVARLEWIIHELRRVAPPEPIAIAELAGAGGDPSRIMLRLSPVVQFIASPYAIDQIWIAHQKDTAWRALRLGSAGVRLQVSALDGVRIADLSASTWEFRVRLANGEDLGTAAAMAIAVSPDFDLPRALAALFGDGFVVGLASKPACACLHRGWQ